MTEGNRNRLIWGAMLLIGALGSASMRNNPALGITPMAIGVIEAVIYGCILFAVRVSGWQAAVVIVLATPVYLWAQRFLDGYMIPVDMAVNLALIGGMLVAMKKKNYWMNVLLLTIPAFTVLLLGGTATIWIVKDETIIRSLIIAWNTDVYVALSLLGAALVCAPYTKKEAR